MAMAIELEVLPDADAASRFAAEAVAAAGQAAIEARGGLELAPTGRQAPRAVDRPPGAVGGRSY